jgi:hypothetical protein
MGVSDNLRPPTQKAEENEDSQPSLLKRAWAWLWGKG